jgi:hypothetical protein
MAQVHTGIHVAVEHKARPTAATAKNPNGIGSIGFNLLTGANQTIALEPVHDERAERIFFTRRAGNIAEIKRESANLVRVNYGDYSIGPLRIHRRLHDS